jgi:hypothetical protein
LLATGHGDVTIKLWQDAARAQQPQPAPEPAGPRWWEDAALIVHPYYARGNGFIQAAGPFEYIIVTPGPEPGDWRPERDCWDRIVTHSYDPAAEFHAWLKMVRHNGVPRGFEPERASPAEEALRRNTAHDPEWELLLREKLKMPKPPTRLEGQLFDPGQIYTDKYISSKFNFNDVGPYLTRHLMGDFGQHGCHADVTPAAVDRACVAAAGVPSRNVLAIESGAGMVQSQYLVRLEGAGTLLLDVRTLIQPGGNITGIGSGG